MKLMSKYRNAASSVGQWPAFLNSANFMQAASRLGHTVRATVIGADGMDFDECQESRLAIEALSSMIKRARAMPYRCALRFCGHSGGVASVAPSAIRVSRQSNAQPGAFLSGTGIAVPLAPLRSVSSADLRDNCPRDDR